MSPVLFEPWAYIAVIVSIVLLLGAAATFLPLWLSASSANSKQDINMMSVSPYSDSDDSSTYTNVITTNIDGLWWSKPDGDASSEKILISMRGGKVRGKAGKPLYIYLDKINKSTGDRAGRIGISAGISEPVDEAATKIILIEHADAFDDPCTMYREFSQALTRFKDTLGIDQDAAGFTTGCKLD